MTATKKIITATSTETHLILESRDGKGKPSLSVLTRDADLAANLLAAVEAIVQPPQAPVAAAPAAPAAAPAQA